MKILALALLVLAASSAQAQKVFRCVDDRGKSTYTEKPGKNCKPVRIDVAPGKAADKPPAAAAQSGQLVERPVRQSAATKLTKKAHCDGIAAEAQQIGDSTAPGMARRRAGLIEELNRSCR